MNIYKILYVLLDIYRQKNRKFGVVISPVFWTMVKFRIVKQMFDKDRVRSCAGFRWICKAFSLSGNRLSPKVNTRHEAKVTKIFKKRC